MRTAGLAFVVALAAWLAPAAALGQSAESLVEQGIAAREEREDVRALELFRQAYELEPEAATLAQIALAEQALGRYVSAEEHLAEALEDDGDRFIRRNRRLLETALEEIRAEIGTVTIAGGPDGAAVYVDGRGVGSLPLDGPVRANAGEQEIATLLEGYEPFRRRVTVEGGGDVEVRVEMVRVPPHEPVREPPPHALTHPGAPIQELLIGIGATSAAVGGVALVGGTIAMVLREDAANGLIEQMCVTETPECVALRDEAIEAERTGIALFIAGGILAGTGVALLLVGLDWEEPDEGGEEQTVRCAPGPLSVACAGRF